jgi:DNA-binding LacI/PurR family transcriptional regulator
VPALATLTERLLYAAGIIDTVGSVDTGTTRTDTLPRQRHAKPLRLAGKAALSRDRHGERAAQNLCVAVRMLEPSVHPVRVPTAITCGDDLQALGVYEAARRAGLRSLTTSASSGSMTSTRPPLTTVRQQFALMGATAARLALAAGQPPARTRHHPRRAGEHRPPTGEFCR